MQSHKVSGSYAKSLVFVQARGTDGVTGKRRGLPELVCGIAGLAGAKRTGGAQAYLGRDDGYGGEAPSRDHVRLSYTDFSDG